MRYHALMKKNILGNASNVSFVDLLNLCRRHFGEPRIKGSHHIFKTPWKGDPRINLQKDGKDAKPYQVRDVIRALEKLGVKYGE
ncbi:MAG: type II toxin-antitoxin system HicA family toxin [Desulfobacterales bacterium]|jgi:predicted RNA binding protein YcfA (HicA-like mRNA interferase family)|nr:type II toxin-antitoxin system HicA family toxin [Desulfobacterales bacterium]